MRPGTDGIQIHRSVIDDNTEAGGAGQEGTERCVSDESANATSPLNVVVEKQDPSIERGGRPKVPPCLTQRGILFRCVM